VSENDLHVFGIRHHGPGSARSLGAALIALEPSIVLIEGPSDVDDELLALAAHAAMAPPVALLQYVPDEPHRAHYYPFAIFSPEWVALRYALERKLPVRFIDLPGSHSLAAESKTETGTERLRRDPLQTVAEAAGYADGERWWEHVVEERHDHTGAFDAVREVMTAVREAMGGAEANEQETLHEARREAWMRQAIRAARREGHERIAVVCGAWHVPALLADVTAKSDTEILKGMTKVKVKGTWIPWTPQRLARESGYGAGVTSPGWYAHLWEYGATPDAAISWMTRVGRVLREEGIDASPAQAIDAVRLANTIAALRGRPVPGLPELTESTVAALLNGDTTPLALVRDRLIIGDALGTVPEAAPMVPLQESLARDQKRLRLPPQASEKTLELDLRQPFDRERSVLLHRLSLLGVEWGRTERSTSRGTFKEVWRIAWRPELAMAVIEAGIWGNTVADAAMARAAKLAADATDLPSLAQLLGMLLVADVPEATRLAIGRLDALAAVSSDFSQLCTALPPMARTLRYGDVRDTDRGLLGHVVEGLVARIAAGLPAACASLDDDAATAMFQHLTEVNDALARASDAELLAMWHEALGRLLTLGSIHGLVEGRAARMLLDAGRLAPDEVSRRWSAVLSRGGDPAAGAAWVDGFLRDSGTLLVHDVTLWGILDSWLSALTPEAFDMVLPLLRRTVSTFSAPERRRLGERARSGATSPVVARVDDDSTVFDTERAAAVLPTIARLLGLPQ